jgi:hypothetical protein
LNRYRDYAIGLLGKILEEDFRLQNSICSGFLLPTAASVRRQTIPQSAQAGIAAGDFQRKCEIGAISNE